MSETLKSRIRERLTALGKSAASASIEAGLGRSAIQNILAGATDSPRLLTLQRLAPVLECTVDYLIGTSEGPEGRSDRSKYYEISQKYLLPNVVVLEADAFRKTPRYASVEHLSKTLHYKDDRFPDIMMMPFFVADNSMKDLGIIEGDFVYIPFLETGMYMELTEGAVVIVARMMNGVDLTERSLREVRVVGPKITLCTCSDDAVQPITFSIDTHYIEGNQFNLYKTDEGHTIAIVGFAVKVMRLLG